MTARTAIRHAALMLLALSSPLVAADRLLDHLKTLQSVEKFGRENQVAQAAWREVVQTPATRLPTIVAALDGANPIAANWIRAAVDSIAERELDRGGELPLADLEEIVKDARRGSASRRLAFEWLARVDTSAPDRLIPGMLDDPELEFRRDAVKRLLDEAEIKSNQQQADAALALYRRAFEKARDVDQLADIVKKLNQLGESPNVARQLGFITTWKLIGPFDNTALAGYDAVYPPETRFDPSGHYQGKNAEVAWIDHTTRDEYGVVDLNKALGKANGVVAYAAVEFESPDARPVELRLGSGNAHKLWLNGRLVSESKSYHTGEQIDQFTGKGELRRGKNLILLKLLQNEQTESWAQEWRFQLRACDALGTPILASNRPD